MPLIFVSQGSNIYKYSKKFFFFSSYSSSVIYSCILFVNDSAHVHESYGLHCLNTCSTEFEFPSPGVKAETIVSPTAIIVSARLSRLGRLAGLALNIGTSGIVSLVAVPTICRKIHVTINTKILLMNIFICLFLAL